MKKTAAEKLIEHGYEGAKYFNAYSYDDALIGVTINGQVVYDYDKMVSWLMDKEGYTIEEAVEWIEYNTICAIDYEGPDAPVIVNIFENV